MKKIDLVIALFSLYIVVLSVTFIHYTITDTLVLNMRLLISSFKFIPALYLSYLFVLYTHELGHFFVAKIVGKEVGLDMIGIRIRDGKLRIFPKELLFRGKREFDGCVFFKPKKMSSREDITKCRNDFILLGLSGIAVNIFFFVVICSLLAMNIIEYRIMTTTFIISSVLIIISALLGDVRTAIQGKNQGYHLMLVIETYLLHKTHGLKFTVEDEKIVRFLAAQLQEELDLKLEGYSKKLKALLIQTLVNTSLLLKENFVHQRLAEDFFENNEKNEKTDVMANIGVDYEQLYSHLEELGFTKETIFEF